MNMVLLKLEGVTKHFGGLVAVSQLDLELYGGEILGVVGPNGAGKTTVFNLISGVYWPDAGEILFRGRNIARLKPNKIALQGLSRTFQISTLYNKCSVLENVIIGHHCKMKEGLWDTLWRTRAFWKEEGMAEENALQLLEFMNLVEYKDVVAANLPHGHQQRLAIAIALSTEPRLLMLDEPFAGMDAVETKEMMGLVDRIRDREISVLLIEHDMKAVMGICDRIVVINYGAKLAEGSPEEIKNNKDVIDAYLGKEDDLT
jgi:branched-chain amino acid transport system ATP-binding protein